MTFTAVLNRVLRSVGLTPTEAEADERAAIASLLTDAMDYAWYWLEGGWPEVTRSAARTASSHIISMARDTGSSILPMGKVLGVYEADPFTDKNPGPLPFSVTVEGVVVNEDVGASAAVHVKFMEPAPLFTSTAWATATDYVVGDVVLEADECYLCIEAHTAGTFSTDLAADRWVIQQVPEFLVETVKTATVAAWRESGGETARMQVLEGILDRRLANVARRYEATTVGILRVDVL